jgi:hypothetical protein
MKTVFVHIGMSKTGTTTLQFHLDANRALLKSSGYCYPLSGLSSSPHEKGHHELVRAAKVRDESVYKALVAEINKTAANAVVLSSEGFSVAAQGEIEFLKKMLDGYEVKIVVYVREQASFLESLYNQAVKTGSEVRDRYEFLADMLSSNRLNYYSVVKGWAAVFGKENIIVREYRAGGSDRRELLEDFFEVVGFDVSCVDIDVKDYNSSVDSRYIEFLRVVNKLGLDPQLKNDKVVSVLLSSGNDVRGSLKVFGSAERKLIRNYCKHSNKMLAREYFGAGVGELFSSGSENIDVVPDAITPEVLAEIVSLFVVSSHR